MYAMYFVSKVAVMAICIVFQLAGSINGPRSKSLYFHEILLCGRLMSMYFPVNTPEVLVD